MRNPLCRHRGLRVLMNHPLWILFVAVVSVGCDRSLAAGDGETSINPPPPLRAGAASMVITPPVGSWQQGAGVTRKGESIRDDLEANALYLTDGETHLLLMSCDLVGLEMSTVRPIREAISAATKIPPRSVIITCTHTHGGPSLVRTNYHMPVDEGYIEQLGPKLVEVSRAAIASATPARVGWGMGEVRIGYNRRVCWADGTHSMHGDIHRPDFAGLEGPDDPAHLAIFVTDMEGNPIAVADHNTSHPTTFYAAGVFSSDYPGVARENIRRELGPIPVLHFNGAQGDIAMPNLLEPEQVDREERMNRIGERLAKETLRLYRQAEFQSNVFLGHAYTDLPVEIRLPDKEEVDAAQKVLDRVDAGEEIRGMELILAFGTVQLRERYGEESSDTLPVHAIRIGDVALVTQPCELYCQFGIDIKRRSPTPLTAVIGMADGYNGYCPTIAGVLGGGYSGQPISWTRLEPFAGYRIVESAGPMLNRLWRGDEKE